MCLIALNWPDKKRFIVLIVNGVACGLSAVSSYGNYKSEKVKWAIWIFAVCLQFAWFHDAVVSDFSFVKQKIKHNE